jgi:DNA-binding transcriptional LysR family regulator
VITPMLADLHARYPDIEIELDADDRVRSLSKREADMAVRVGRPIEHHVVAQKMCDFTSTAYASRAYLEANGTPRGGDLSGHALIAFSDVLTEGREARWLDQHAPRGRIVFRSMSTNARIRAAKAGMGIAVLPCYVGDDEPELVRLVEPAGGVSSNVWLVVHRDLQHTARVRVCADFLAERFRADAPRFVGARRRANPGVRPLESARRRAKTR